MNDNCLYCENYAIWDGDYACVSNLSLLSFMNKDGSASNPERVLSEKNKTCDQFKQIENPIIINRNIIQWNCLNPKITYKPNNE